MLSKYYNDFDIKIVNKNIINNISSLNDVEGLVYGKTIYLDEDISLDIRNENIEITASDKILIIQTCHYNPYDTYLLVIAKETI